VTDIQDRRRYARGFARCYSFFVGLRRVSRPSDGAGPPAWLTIVSARLESRAICRRLHDVDVACGSGSLSICLLGTLILIERDQKLDL